MALQRQPKALTIFLMKLHLILQMDERFESVDLYACQSTFDADRISTSGTHIFSNVTCFKDPEKRTTHWQRQHQPQSRQTPQCPMAKNAADGLSSLVAEKSHATQLASAEPILERLTTNDTTQTIRSLSSTARPLPSHREFQKP